MVNAGALRGCFGRSMGARFTEKASRFARGASIRARMRLVLAPHGGKNPAMLGAYAVARAEGVDA